MAKVAVIGAGSWGTALAKVLHTNGNQVTVWSIVEAEIAMLRERHEHVDKLPGVKLPEDMEFTTDLKAAVEDKEYLILAVPSVFTRSTAKSMAPFVKAGQIIVCVAKGIEENTLMTLSDIVEEEVPAAEVAVMCGPSHAEEVGVGLPTTVVAGAKKRKVAEGVQDIFKTIQTFISDPNGSARYMAPLFQIINDIPYYRFFAFVPRIHFHANRDLVCIKKKSHTNNRFLFILF